MKYKLSITLVGASTFAVFFATSHALQPTTLSVDQSSQTNMVHSTHMMQEPAEAGDSRVFTSPLTEPGNDVFATLQEVVNQLLQDDSTDWEKVDLESLRQHLIDMENFIVNVQLVSKTDIGQGVQVIVEPGSKQVADSLDRALSAHPAVLKQETGWSMVSEKSGTSYIIQITSTNSDDLKKIRALGYIGIMTMGNHHQLHHWAMASGNNPHRGH